MDLKEPQIEPLSNQEADEMWEDVISRIRVHEDKKRRRKIIQFSSTLAAAIVILLFSFLTYRIYYSPTVYYAKETEMTITLKDSSQITLSKGSKLTVEKSFPSDTRDVFLEGDAVFNVSKSKVHPFIVHAGKYQAKVLGTIFKVVQKDSIFNVDLYEGKVQVSKTAKPEESYMVHPKESFSNMGSSQVASVSPTNRKVSVKKNNTATLSFTDFYLQDAINIIEKTYGIKIKLPADRVETRISVVSQDATADELIQRISIQLNLNKKKINANTFQLEE